MIGYVHGGGGYEHTCWLNAYCIYTAVRLALERELFSSFLCVCGGWKTRRRKGLQSPGFGVGGLEGRVLSGRGGHPGEGEHPCGQGGQEARPLRHTERRGQVEGVAGPAPCGGGLAECG